jgi:hypothetical protein
MLNNDRGERIIPGIVPFGAVSASRRRSDLFQTQMMSQADGDILTTIKDLREGQIDGSIELVFRPAANLAMVALTAQVHGSDQPRIKSFAGSLHDMRYRIEQARLDGDQERPTKIS